MPDVPIVNRALVTAPKDYTLPQSQEVLLRCVRAAIDGTSATSPFLPTLQLVSNNGDVMWSAVDSANIVAAGGSADVTWFPGLTGNTTSAGISVVGARIYSVASQSIANSTAQDFTFDTVDFDTSGMTNLGVNNRILTATVPGLYLAIASVTYASNTNGIRQVLIYHNGFFSVPSGNLVAPSLWNASNTVGTSTGTFVATLVNMSAGDFLSCGVFQTSGGALSSSAGATNQPYQNYMAATLVGVV